MTNMDTFYVDARMNLNDVCEWLQGIGFEDLSDIIKDKFSGHTWVKDGMIRKDIVKEIFERVFESNDMFKELECEVTTALDFVPLHEAHID